MIDRYTDDSFDIICNHKAIVTTICPITLSLPAFLALKFHFKKIDRECFSKVLQAQKNIITSELALAERTTRYFATQKEILDVCSLAIFQAIYQSHTLSPSKIFIFGNKKS